MLDVNEILIVDDEPIICELIESILQSKGYMTHSAYNGKAMLEYLTQKIPSLIILDYQLPDLTGHSLCQKVRQQSQVPILMVTAHDSQANLIRGFELGIDDFLAKPFDPKELLLRIEAILRRSRKTQMALSQSTQEDQINYQFDRWHFEPSALNLVDKNNMSKKLNLTEYEVKLLSLFCANAERIITREQIHKALESHADDASLQAINVYVYRLRNKIGKDLIQSIRYKGYKFLADVQVIAS
ncbi:MULTISPECIES: response regulator transcription factor [Cysteiniphilum]|uniref:response regulator transcription factor n=1 Tax=Cysteiniphilum TaxID=2056696 RepID=UPI001786E028|nr:MULTISPECIES: response regulator transcription factor [Cysteiniphilum]